MANLLTVGEVAEYLRTTTTTIYRWLKEGKLTAVKIGKSWRIDEDLLNAFINQQKNIPDAPASFWSTLRQNEHLMVITNRNDEVFQFEASFFKQALAEGARIMKGCWWQNEDELAEQYAKQGLDVSALTKDGVFKLVNFNKLYKKEGIEGPINAWCTNIQKAVTSGSRRLWASGSPNMSCCGNDANHLLAFESRLHEAIKSLPVMGICPYSLEDESNKDHFGKLVTLMRHHSGVAFYSGGQCTLLRG